MLGTWLSFVPFFAQTVTAASERDLAFASAAQHAIRLEQIDPADEILGPPTGKSSN